MSPQIKYAYKRHNTWIYRRTYPKALQPILGSALKQSSRPAMPPKPSCVWLSSIKPSQPSSRRLRPMPLLPLSPLLPLISPLLPKLLDWGLLALDISVLVLWAMGW